MNVIKGGVGRVLRHAFALVTALTVFGSSADENYPSRPINFVIAMPAGSGSDALARYYANRLQERVKVPVIVENRPGANGILTARALKEANPDGYTLTIGSNSFLASNLAAVKDLPYDPVKDFTPIAGLVRVPNIIVVPANSPFKTLADLVAYAKEHPNRLTFAASSASHNIATHALMQLGDFTATSIPYNGPPQGLVDTAAGTVDFMLVDYPAARTLIEGGRLRVLAVSSKERTPDLAGVPTVEEAGIGDFDYFSWAGVYGPAGLPESIVERLSSLTLEIMSSEDALEAIAKRGELPYLMNAQEIAEFQKANIEWWKSVAQQAGIEPQ